MTSQAATAQKPPEGEIFTLRPALFVALVTAIGFGVLFFPTLAIYSFVLAAREDNAVIFAVGLLHLAFGGVEALALWQFLFRKPRYVFGSDRVQYWQGKLLRWEGLYEDMAPPALFVRHTLARVPYRCLGMRLQRSEEFDRNWPRQAQERARNRRRFGYDLVIPTQMLAETPERMHETLLTCYHCYHRGEEKSATPPDSP
jgi:hypothetical protein